MKKITAACCNKDVGTDSRIKYRNKTWCGNEECKEAIDIKVKANNMKKKQRKIASGTHRTGVDKELRQQILERDQFLCGVCELFDDSYGIMQVHHVIPVSCGGQDDLSNLVTVCKDCHKTIHQIGWEKYVSSFKTNI